MKFEELTLSLTEEGWRDVAAAAMLGIGALKGGGDVKAAEPTSITQQIAGNPIQDSSFIEYIKGAENSVKAGWDKNLKKWFPHKSAEGGKKTLAYGHKLKSGEDFSNGITDQEAHNLLQADLKIADDKAKRQVDTKYGEGTYDKLDNKRKQMLIDFTYNLKGGLDTFPTFTKGVVTNNPEIMKREYQRKYLPAGKANKKENYLPIEDRNNRFKAFFLDNLGKTQPTQYKAPIKKASIEKSQQDISSYEVKSGDSLWRIAKNHGTTIEKIKKDNGLKSDTIHPGQKLKIIK